MIAEAAGRLKWVSPALPGSTHDVTAAREHAFVEALTAEDVMAFADKGLSGRVRQYPHPVQAHRRRRRLSRREKAVNRSRAKIRAIGERAIAALKCWRLLAKLHCCPTRATNLLATDPAGPDPTRTR